MYIIQILCQKNQTPSVIHNVKLKQFFKIILSIKPTEINLNLVDLFEEKLCFCNICELVLNWSRPWKSGFQVIFLLVLYGTWSFFWKSFFRIFVQNSLTKLIGDHRAILSWPNLKGWKRPLSSFFHPLFCCLFYNFLKLT